MTLSPEDVIKKSFSATHLRRGYDETQVDDFLDEVVVELRRLLAENDGLRADLEDCQAGRGSTESSLATIPTPRPDDATGDLEARNAELAAEVESLQAQLDSAAEGQPAADAEAVADPEIEDKVASLEAQLTSGQEALAAAEQRAEHAEARVADLESQVEQAGQVEQTDVTEVDESGTGAGAEVTEQQVAALAATGGASGSQNATSILSLAQKLHDEHVAEGEETKARLVEEAESYRDQVVGEADARSAELISTGQAQHDELVRTGQETHDRLVSEGQDIRARLIDEGETTKAQLISEAEERRNSVLEELGHQQAAITGKINDLNSQETDLRDKLRTFLSDQLNRVESGTQRD